MVRGIALVLSLICVLFLAAAGAAAKRVALVVGNNAYTNLPAERQLQRARADADAVSQAFKALGFEVLDGRDLTRSQLNIKIIDLANLIQPGDTVAFFFAGHGVRLENRNYLLASDVPKITSARRELLKSESIAVDTLVARFRGRGARVSFLILDACRNDPFTDKTGRSVLGTRGFAPIDPPEGAFVMFSAGAGQEALDRLPGHDPDPNSVFTRVLLEHMHKPGLEIARMARLVRRSVRNLARKHGHAQSPASYNELIGDFFLNEGTAVSPKPVVPKVSSSIESDFELARSIGTKQAWQSFLALHGGKTDHPRVDLARAALQKLAVGVFNKPDAVPAPQQASKCEGIQTTVAGKPRCLKHGEVFRDCPDCPEMVVIPPGKFLMGSPESEKGRDGDMEGPQRIVRIGKVFAAGKFEVTFAEWDRCVSDGGCSGYRAKAKWGRARQPVINVYWSQAQEFVTWLNNKTNRNYRLLSEAEWEYAARARTQTPFWTGERIKTDQANFRGNYITRYGKRDGIYRKQTLTVGSFAANGFGLHDVIGNVAEWVEDCYPGSRVLEKDGEIHFVDEGGECTTRIVRGGSWQDHREHIRSAFRGGRQGTRSDTVGFRIARTFAEVDANPVLDKDSNTERPQKETDVAVGLPPPATKPEAPSCDGVETTVAGKKRCLKHGDVFRDCPDCPEMVVIPPGKFLMGSPADEKERWLHEGPRRVVTISSALAVGKFEVTVDQFASFVGETGHKVANSCIVWSGSKWKNTNGRSYLSPGFKQSGSHPVVCVDWTDSQAYAEWLSRKTGQMFRLLTEAEWEYSARAGTQSAFSQGERITADQANFNGNHTYNGSAKGRYRKKTVAVGSFNANAFGLHSMHGNVWEWVQDCYRDSYEGAPSDGSAVAGRACGYRVLRGGSWSARPRVLRSASRFKNKPSIRGYGIGFRVARTLAVKP